METLVGVLWKLSRALARSLCLLRKFALSTLSIKWKYHKSFNFSLHRRVNPLKVETLTRCSRLDGCTERTLTGTRGEVDRERENKQKQLTMFEEVTGNDLMVCGRQQKWNKIDFLRSSFYFLRFHSIIFRSGGGGERHSLPPFPIRICHTHACLSTLGRMPQTLCLCSLRKITKLRCFGTRNIFSLWQKLSF